MSCWEETTQSIKDFFSGVNIPEDIIPDTPILPTEGGSHEDADNNDTEPLTQNPQNNTGTCKDGLPCERSIEKAYFATKRTIQVPIGNGASLAKTSYIVKSGDSLSKIAKKYKGVSYKDIAKENGISAPKYNISVGQTLLIPNQVETKDKIVYKKISYATLGAKVFLVVETKGFKKGESVNVKIYEKASMLVGSGKELPFLKGTIQHTEAMAIVKIDQDSNKQQAVTEIALRPKIDKIVDDKARSGSLEGWKEKFKKGVNDKEGKKDYLWLKVSDLQGKVEEKEFLKGGELVVESNCNNDKNLGTLSSQYETGGRGSITVSGGVGDWGGVSYGAYQLTSKPHGGNVTKFINSSSFPWTKDFKGLTAGTNLFSKRWKKLVALHGESFVKIEHEYIKQTHFDILAKKIKKDNQINIKCHSHTLNDVIWSTAVQMGPKTSVIKKAISNVSIPYAQEKRYDKALIEAIYNERGRKKTNGDLVYFSKNSKKVQQGVASRFISESKKALKRLAGENYP